MFYNRFNDTQLIFGIVFHKLIINVKVS